MKQSHKSKTQKELQQGNQTGLHRLTSDITKLHCLTGRALQSRLHETLKKTLFMKKKSTRVLLESLGHLHMYLVYGISTESGKDGGLYCLQSKAYPD